jgi:hypothetical protein
LVWVALGLPEKNESDSSRWKALPSMLSAET